MAFTAVLIWTKLVRSTLDALTTAGVYEDDGRVVCLAACKRYAAEWTGARITVSERDPS